MTEIRDYVAAHADRLYADLDAWLRIPSISAEPEHAADVRRSAEWAAEALRRSGFPTVEVWETEDGGHPAVYAERLVGDDRPTVVVYGHHDVQPVDPVEQWHTPPFEPTVRGDDLYARGAVDDKGQVLFHLLGLEAALAAYGELGGQPQGRSSRARRRSGHRTSTRSCARTASDSLRRRRGQRHRDLRQGHPVDVRRDARPRLLPGRPLRTRRRPALRHRSAAACPTRRWRWPGSARRLHDADNRVTLPGFYDRVVPLTDRERELMAELPFDEAAWLRDAASTATWGEKGYTTLERVGARPTAEVNGIWGGYIGVGRKTIVPAEAHAKISLPPGRRPGARGGRGAVPRLARRARSPRACGTR